MLRDTPNYCGCILRTACDEESQIHAQAQIAALKVQYEKEKEEFMQVDVAQELDIDEMVALDALVSGNESRRNLITQIVKQHHGYVARQEIKIVGFLLMHEHFFELPFIELLIVHPSFRRQGIGTALMQHIETIYTPGKLFTSTNLSNERMQRLCERLGYVRSGIIEHLDEDDPELFYFKRLTQEAPYEQSMYQWETP